MSKKSAVFKPDRQHQTWLFPPSLSEMIPAEHKVRLINSIIDGMNIDSILATYKGGGTSAYPPRILLKILVYGYSERIYSSRKLEAACKENVCFMWLTGMVQPDHGTINTFRRHRLGQTVKDVFAHVLLALYERGYVKLEDYYLDGTTMESVAGRYTYVWRTNVERYKKSLLDKIALIVSQLDELCERADEGDEPKSGGSDLGESDLGELSDSEAVKKAIGRLNTALAAKEAQAESKEKSRELSKAKTKLNNLESKQLAKLKEYERQQEILGGRSSYSKTDEDATFMKTKDDHFKKAQAKPSYNVQVGTENHFVVNWTMHDTTSDSACFVPHMVDTKTTLEGIGLSLPKSGTADGAYGNEENYNYCEENGIAAYIKYPGYYKESKGTLKHPFDPSQLFFNEKENVLICPMGQRMAYCGQSEEVTKRGYKRLVSKYKAANCVGCPLRGRCHKQEGNRIVRLSLAGRKYREQARHRLSSEEGQEKKIRRNIEVEGFFGNLKANLGVRRFTLKGLEGTNIEMGLLSIATNLRRMHKIMVEQGSSLLSPIKMSAKTGEIG